MFNWQQVVHNENLNFQQHFKIMVAYFESY